MAQGFGLISCDEVQQASTASAAPHVFLCRRFLIGLSVGDRVRFGIDCAIKSGSVMQRGGGQLRAVNVRRLAAEAWHLPSGSEHDVTPTPVPAQVDTVSAWPRSKASYEWY